MASPIGMTKTHREKKAANNTTLHSSIFFSVSVPGSIHYMTLIYHMVQAYYAVKAFHIQRKVCITNLTPCQLSEQHTWASH